MSGLIYQAVSDSVEPQLRRVSEDPELQVRDIRDNFDQLEQAEIQRRGSNPLARLGMAVGGACAEGIVLEASTSAEEDVDVVIQHGLGRIPSRILVGIPTDGLGGQVYGNPAGGSASSGGNQQAWTTEYAYLRASRSATYDVVLI